MNIKDIEYTREGEVKQGIEQYVSCHPGQPATDFLLQVASVAKGFRCIPYDLLTDEVIRVGLGHLTLDSTMTESTWKNTYAKTLLALVGSWEGYSLEGAHSGFVDEAILTLAFQRASEATENGSRWSYESGLSELLDDKVVRLMNDDIARDVLKSRNDSAVFSSAFSHKISASVYSSAILAKPDLACNLYFAERQEILVDLIKSGFWADASASVNPGEWQKPNSCEDAIDRIMSGKDRTNLRFFLTSFLLAQPIHDVIPLLKPNARKTLLDELYTTDQLLPLMRAFPFLKGRVLESELGM
jgi:hypothetical protein